MANFRVPQVNNEPNVGPLLHNSTLGSITDSSILKHHYAKGTAQREGLTAAIQKIKSQPSQAVPLFIGGQAVCASPLPVTFYDHLQYLQVTTDSRGTQVNPASHKTVLATYSKASVNDVKTAVDATLSAKQEWESLPFTARAAIFLKAADLIATKYRYEVMATTMLGQGKNAWQAEIDSAAELVDFLRFNVKYAEELYSNQPVHHAPGVWNRVEYRPLEGFVYAVTPFNFTAIGANLAVLPALLGNVVIWKPSDFAVLSNWTVYRILLEAGLPPNVIQWVPGDPEVVTKVILDHGEFSGLHYTGSTAVFRYLYGEIGAGIARGAYRSYPRIVGETGGKNFHLLHPSADLENAAVQTIRGAFEFQGQKCSATSRAYVPTSVWPEFRERLVKETERLKIGDPTEYENFIGPVIHARSFEKIAQLIDQAKNDPEIELLAGGTYDDSEGYFIHPTIYRTTNPGHNLLKEEIFGPVLVVYTYDDAGGSQVALEKVCELADSTSQYGLTGAVFAQDRVAIEFLQQRLRNAAGNFYINCKSTGAVVGQQPFGGSRASGTNDKAGSMNLLSRFVSMRSIKEELVPTTEVLYPSNKV